MCSKSQHGNATQAPSYGNVCWARIVLNSTLVLTFLMLWGCLAVPEQPTEAQPETSTLSDSTQPLEVLETTELLTPPSEPEPEPEPTLEQSVSLTEPVLTEAETSETEIVAAEITEAEPVPPVADEPATELPLVLTAKRSREEALRDSRYAWVEPGLIRDIETGLDWSACSVGQTINRFECEGLASELDQDTVQRTLADWNARGAQGFSDWRLPTIAEFMTLFICTRESTEPEAPCADQASENVYDAEIWAGMSPRHYWAVTTDTQAMYAVNLRYGNAAEWPASSRFAVRFVREP